MRNESPESKELVESPALPIEIPAGRNLNLLNLRPVDPVKSRRRYDPSFCSRVVDFMAGGYSLTAFAGEIGVPLSTVRSWLTLYPDFCDLVEIGQAKRVKHHEEVLSSSTSMPRVTAHSMMLKSAAPWEYNLKEQVQEDASDTGVLRDALVSGFKLLLDRADQLAVLTGVSPNLRIIEVDAKPEARSPQPQPKLESKSDLAVPAGQPTKAAEGDSHV